MGSSDFRFMFQLNSTLAELEFFYNILFIGSNPRLEVPLLNSRLRKNFVNNADFAAYSIGLALNYSTYPIFNLGIVLIL